MRQSRFEGVPEPSMINSTFSLNSAIAELACIDATKHRSFGARSMKATNRVEELVNERSPVLRTLATIAWIASVVLEAQCNIDSLIRPLQQCKIGNKAKRIATHGEECAIVVIHQHANDVIA